MHLYVKTRLLYFLNQFNSVILSPEFLNYHQQPIVLSPSIFDFVHLNSLNHNIYVFISLRIKFKCFIQESMFYASTLIEIVDNFDIGEYFEITKMIIEKFIILFVLFVRILFCVFSF